MWRWRKVPKSVMEKLKPWSTEEIERRQFLVRMKCEKELDKVDWDMMRKHFRTPEALKEYESFCDEARSNIIDRLTGLVGTGHPDPYLQHLYGKFAHLPFTERMLLKWTRGKNLFQKRLPEFKMLGLGLGSGLVVGAGAFKLLGNKKEKGLREDVM